MLSIVQNLSVLVAGLLLLYLLGCWSWRRPVWAVCVAISATALLDCLQMGTEGVSLGVNLYPGDAATVILMLAGCLAVLRKREGLRQDVIPCLVLLALVVLNFCRGVSAFGVKAAGNSARNLLMFAVPAASVMLLQPLFRIDAGRLARWLTWAGCVLCAIATLRWVGVLPMPVGLEESLREVTRALPADYAFVIGLALIASVFLHINARPMASGWLAVAVFGGVTLLLQHRSVWVATAAGTGWLIVRPTRTSARRWLGPAIAGAVILGGVALAGPEIRQKVELLVITNVRETQGADSTWAWRVSGYLEATNRFLNSSVTDMFIGPPAGWGADSSDSFASVHIHSRYVDTLAYYGIAGLACLLMWLGLLAKRTAQPGRSIPGMSRGNHLEATLLQALLLSEAVYLIPYYGGILHGAILGLIWVSATQTESFIALTELVPKDAALAAETRL